MDWLLKLIDLGKYGIAVGGDDPVRRYLPRRYWNKARDYFQYVLDFNTLAADAVQQNGVIQINNESDFLVMELTLVEATSAAGTTEQTYAPITVQVQDTGSGAQWFSGRQHLQAVFGRLGINGTGPFRLPQPRFVEGGSSLTVDLTNLESTARRVWLGFHGLKIYRNIREGQ